MTIAGATARLAPPRGRARALLLLAAFTLLLHAPFLRQPVRGDEYLYLNMARETLQHPLTPLSFQYVFQGNDVNMAGHPHPPFSAYFLALLWMIRGQFSVVFFHAVYLVFPLTVAWAGYLLAERFTPNPLWAALLLAASPLVQVNTNTVASPEAPALAFLLTGALLFFRRRFLLAGLCLALAGFSALQVLAIAPILLLEYALRKERPPRAAWLAVATPFLALVGWQLFQFAMTSSLPAALLFGHATGSTYGRPILRLTNALALVQHLGILIVFLPLVRPRGAGLAAGIPAGLIAAVLVPGYPWWERALLFLFLAAGVHALVWIHGARRDQPFLAAWCLAYFAFALAAFFAGAARYLLPVTAPVVFLFVRECASKPRRLAVALAISLFLGLNISYADYEFSSIYTRVPAPSGAPFLVNGEWGFRYYLEEKGGRPITRASAPAVPGEWIVASELSVAANYDSLAECVALPVRTLDLTVRSPLRLVDRFSHSGFSSAAFGLLPFSFSTRPFDRITYWRTSPFLNVDAPWVPTQFSNRLVYLSQPGVAVRLPLEASWSRLHLVPFAQGSGKVVFSVCTPQGEEILRQEIESPGGFGEPRDIALHGQRELVLRIEAPADARAGWGELNAFSDNLEPQAGGVAPAAEQGPLSYINTGDLRAKPQLLSGWYAIEDGAWRWMSREAEAVLAVPSGAPLTFELRLFFPPDHMQKAGDPVVVAVLFNDTPFAEETYTAPGGYTLSKAVPTGLLRSAPAKLTIRLSRAAPPTAADQRELGAVVSGFGFK